MTGGGGPGGKDFNCNKQGKGFGFGPSLIGGRIYEREGKEVNDVIGDLCSVIYKTSVNGRKIRVS